MAVVDQHPEGTLPGAGRARWRRLGRWLVLVASLCAAAPAQREGVAAAHLELLSAAREQQARDLAAWREFRFVRDVERQRRGRNGGWQLVERLSFLVEPAGDRGFDERLRRIDGRAPTRKEVESHREAGRFGKHYDGVLSGRAEEVDEGYALADLLSLPSYTFAGAEEIAGVRCLRFDFEPAQDAPAGFAGRIARASRGSLWLSADGGHLVRARAETVAAVRFAGGLVRIPHLEVSYEGRAAEDGVWLPVEIGLESEISLFGNGTERRNRYSYSEFERVAE